MATTAPTRDIGRPDFVYGTWGQGLLTQWYETAADLIWPQSVITYARMRNDPQIKAILAAYKLPLLRATWVVDGTGCRDEVTQHVADDLGVGIMSAEDTGPGPARRRGVIWHRHLKEALTYLVFGHMCFERRYEPQPGGYERLVSLGSRAPWTITQMKINDAGVLQAIEQTTQRDPIPGDRLVWYANDVEGANWAGQSMLRPAFGAWLLKHETWRVHATSIRRFGMGVPTVKAPAGGTAAQVAQAQQLASAMRSGDSAGMGLPQGFEASLMGMTGSVPDALAFIKYLDVAMAKMTLTGLIELGQTDTGSRALGETFMDLFLLSLQAVADDIATTATSGYPGLPGIITGLVDTNWGEDEPAPRLVCTDVGENYETNAASIQSLVTSGALTPDAALDAWIRQTWRLPERTDKWVPSSRGLPAGTTVTPAAEARTPVGQADVAKVQQGEGAPAPAAPAPGKAAPGKAPAVAAATRAQARYIDASTWEPDQHQADWERALAALLVQYRSVMSAQRTDLVDRVITAMQSGQSLIMAAPAVGNGPDLVMQAMVGVARKAAQAMADEAERQGVRINLERVAIDATALGGTAQARAEFYSGWMAQQATAKALQVHGPTPEGYIRAADEVDKFLGGLSDTALRDQLGAALTVAQNQGRIAVLEAAPASAGRDVKYVAAEFLDRNTCDHCRHEDGTEFDTLQAATAAYPTGGFRECEGLLRCRGTVVAVWGPDPPTPGSGRYPYKQASVSAKFNPLQPRDPHNGKWWRTGGATKQTIEQFTDANGKWTPERAALHDKIVEGILAGHSPQPRRVATYFGGGPAAGKSELKAVGDDAAKIDPDKIKDSLPEYEGLKKTHRKDASSLVHEESAVVAKLAVKRAQERNLNYVLDGSGDSSYEKMSRKVTAAKAAGYEVHGRYATLDTGEALRRAEERAKKTGRYVPPPYLIATHSSVSRVFDQAVTGDPLFHSTELFDNNVPQGTPAQKIAEHRDGQFRVFDQKAYDKFLAKGAGVTASQPSGYGAMTGDDATAILLAVLMGRTLADSGVPDSADARKLWDDMERSVETMPPGMVADIPAEWPDTEPPAATAAAGGGADPKVPGLPRRTGGGFTGRFNPAEPRNPLTGEWIDVPGGHLRPGGGGRRKEQTPTRFTHPATGHRMGKTEIGDTFEAMFQAKGAHLVEAAYGGPYTRTSGGGGPRNVPLDFQLDHTHAGELKTLNARAANQKTAIKAAEVARKQAAADTAGLKPLLVVQVVDPASGRAEVYSFPAFASKTTKAMTHHGGYRFGPEDFKQAQIDTGHWDQRDKRARDQGLSAAAPDQETLAPGDTFIVLRGGVPYIGTQGVTARFNPDEPRDPLTGEWITWNKHSTAYHHGKHKSGKDYTLHYSYAKGGWDAHEGTHTHPSTLGPEIGHGKNVGEAKKVAEGHAAGGGKAAPKPAAPQKPKLTYDRALATETMLQVTRDYGGDTYGWQKDVDAGRVKRMTVPADKVRLLQEPFPGKVNEYTDRLKNGEDIGRPVAVRSGDHYVLLDGNHKASARVDAGATTLDVDLVTPGVRKPDAPPAPEHKVGDRVRFTSNSGDNKPVDGTVIEVSGDRVKIQFTTSQGKTNTVWRSKTTVTPLGGEVKPDAPVPAKPKVDLGKDVREFQRGDSDPSPALRAAVNEAGPDAPEMYRGLRDKHGDPGRIAKLNTISQAKPGQVLDGGGAITSWSPDKAVADDFAGVAAPGSDALRRGQTGVVLRMEPGAHALSVAGLGQPGYQHQQEWLARPSNLEVVSNDPHPHVKGLRVVTVKETTGTPDKPKPAAPRVNEPLTGPEAYGAVPQVADKFGPTADEYTGDGADAVNGLLRHGSAGPGADDKQYTGFVKEMDGMFAAQEPTKQPMTLYRGLTSDALGKPGTATGKSFQDKGYTSTTAQKRIAVDHYIDKINGQEPDEVRALMEVRVPAGVRMVKPGEFNWIGHGSDPHQELVLNRSGTYKIVSDQTTGGQRIVVAEYTEAGGQ